MRTKQRSQIRISLKMLQCKEKTVIFFSPAEEMLAYQKITLTANELVVAKNNTKTNIYQNKVFSKKMRIAQSSSLTLMDLGPLGKISSWPPQSLRCTNQLVHWLILGDFCRYSFMRSGISRYTVLSRFQPFQFH